MGSGRSARVLDEVDRRILDELVRDGRTSVRTLAERIHISRTNAYARVERLLRDGVITGFRAQVAPEAAGLGTSAYIALTIEQNTWREVSAELARVRYIEHAALLSGEHDVLALVRAPDNAALRDVVLDRVQRIAGVLSTRSWLVFEEFDGTQSPWQ
ncbi:Lrp/AsnC family transcriptional regulator [Micromonospora sp. D93]|uniref:Lrp/AsnC family transcriptional regulator n=1 Tax=Micromonospora sp. D93 TaxID=2824886 RepID=UPI001B386DA4|nr:Lrp/AsnC family transcriptional regulator [Micromonospora sp. D93]